MPAHQPPCRSVTSPVMDRPVSASALPCHGWTASPVYPAAAGILRPYAAPGTGPGVGERCLAGGGPGGLCPVGGPQCPAVTASPYPSPPLSTHGRSSSCGATADLRWSPVSQLGADDSWPPCAAADLPAAENRLRLSLPVDLVVSGDVMPGDFELGHSAVRQSGLSAYTGQLVYVRLSVCSIVLNFYVTAQRFRSGVCLSHPR